MTKCRICRRYWRHLVSHHGYADPRHRQPHEGHHRQPSLSSSATTVGHARSGHRQPRQGPRRQPSLSSSATTVGHTRSSQFSRLTVVITIDPHDDGREHPGYIIRGPPPAIQYCGKLEKYCHWGNEVKLYERHVDTLFAMFWHKEPGIKYYVCTINKTFAKPGQRMYFQVHYTKYNLKKYIDSDDDKLKVSLTGSDLHIDCCFMLQIDKRATITTNWSEFRYHANIRERDICAFCFEITTKNCLALIVHRL